MHFSFQKFVVTYNSTRARWHPAFLDVYIQGTLTNGFVQPYYQLLRTSYPNDTNTLSFEHTVRTSLALMTMDQSFNDRCSFL